LGFFFLSPPVLVVFPSLGEKVLFSSFLFLVELRYFVLETPARSSFEPFGTLGLPVGPEFVGDIQAAPAFFLLLAASSPLPSYVSAGQFTNSFREPREQVFSLRSHECFFP